MTHSIPIKPETLGDTQVLVILINNFKRAQTIQCAVWAENHRVNCLINTE